MVQKQITITNETGIHARPASRFVSFVGQYGADITIMKEGTKINAKSILGVLTLGLSKGTEITLAVSGQDEERILDEVIAFLNSLND